ncbi:PREDICTED: pre-mRNA-processing factor 39-like isoform X2 [Poecilia mexicana]|uniref:pre-mRNA-processing factor 39-like isoform X2 n=1 Tax=Poecilia mexicana TaxID=48701 RepID=UPI00072E78C2|nr:PREDICTED: pre-mRNA-processing factor 39-like isoform X2 [Poecilia mexicana]
MEEKMEDQRRLMDFTRIPKIILHRIDLPQCWVCKEEEVLNEFSYQDGKSSSYKEEPEHQEFKEEEKPLCISQDEEQLVVKQETDDILVNPPNVQRIHNETEPQRNQLISPGSAEDENQDQEGSKSEDPGKKRGEEQKHNKRCQKDLPQHCVYKEEEVLNETEPQRNQLISHGSPDAENQDQEGSDSEDPGKKRKKEQKQEEKYEKTKQQKGRTDTEKEKHKKAHQGKNYILVKFVIKLFLKRDT